MLFTPRNSRIVGPAILLPGGIRFNTEAIHPAADQVSTPSSYFLHHSS